jgi:cephalosporin hydroxylase
MYPGHNGHMAGRSTGDGIVQIGYLHGDTVSYSWHHSLDAVRDFDRDNDLHVIARRSLNIPCGSGVLITPMRNYMAKLFLDGTPHEWLLICDTDMGFEPDAVHKLLASADPTERPIVGGLCFAAMTANYDGMGGWRQALVPTMYKIGNIVGSDQKRFCFYGPYERNAVLRVAATGTAFLLVHRSVLERLREIHGDEWFSQVRDESGDTVGEDLALCLRAGAAGFKMFVNTGVRTSHHKRTWITEDDYLAVSGLQSSDLEAPYPDLPVAIDLEASCRALAANEHDRGGMLKFADDLDRYRQIIEQTKPEVIIETGTHTGASARWLAEASGAEVLTIDTCRPPAADGGMLLGVQIDYITGSSVDPDIVQSVSRLVNGRRAMVILDSDHSQAHVTKEIELYGRLVTPGCYLVVEDTIFGYASNRLVDQHFPDGLEGTPLDAVFDLLAGNDGWLRDMAIERLSPISSNPAGWWIRHE